LLKWGLIYKRLNPTENPLKKGDKEMENGKEKRMDAKKLRKDFAWMEMKLLY